MKPAALALLLASAVPARAAFDDMGFGPRDAAMGGAFTAVHDDAAALAYNPASIGQLPAPQVAGAYRRLFHVPAGESDRDSTRAAVAAPLRTLKGAAGAQVRYDRRTNLSKDREIGLTFATRGLRETEGGGLDFGGSLKLLGVSPESGGSPGTKPAIDLGALWRTGGRYALGASLLNLGGAKFKTGAFSDRAPLALRVGGAETLRSAVLAVDAVVREPSGGLGRSVSFGAGFERWWALARGGSAALRSGVSLGNQTRTWSWGAGWRALGGQVDYVMTVPLSGTTRFGHGVAITARFGRADPEGEYERLLSEELRYRRDLSEALEASSLRQLKLAEELARLRAEIDALRGRLAASKESQARTRQELEALERRHREAARRHGELEAERAATAAKSKQALFNEDWRAYQKAKLSGASDAALLERLSRLLREHRDSGADLGEANQELRRLQRAR